MERADTHVQAARESRCDVKHGLFQEHHSPVGREFASPRPWESLGIRAINQVACGIYRTNPVLSTPLGIDQADTTQLDFARGLPARPSASAAHCPRTTESAVVSTLLFTRSSIRTLTSAATSRTSAGARTVTPCRSRRATIRGLSAADFTGSLDRILTNPRSEAPAATRFDTICSISPIEFSIVVRECGIRAMKCFHRCSFLLLNHQRKSPYTLHLPIQAEFLPVSGKAPILLSRSSHTHRASNPLLISACLIPLLTNAPMTQRRNIWYVPLSPKRKTTSSQITMASAQGSPSLLPCSSLCRISALATRHCRADSSLSP